MTGKNIFVTHTPYHVILSAAIAKDTDHEENHLVMVQDSVESGLVSAVSDSDNFSSIDLFSGLYFRDSFLSRRCAIVKNVISLRNHILKEQPDSLYVFNDYRQEIQSALHAAKKTGSEVLHVEDGAAAYSSHTLEEKSPIGKILRKLCYGYWWEDVNVLGTSKWIDAAHVTAPDYVRPELKDLPLNEIPKEQIVALSNQTWFREYLEQYSVRQSELEDLDGIFAVAHPDFANSVERYEEQYIQLIDRAQAQGQRVGVKYHPRDPHQDFLSVTGDENVVHIPKQLPLEFVYLAIEEPDFVISDVSTTLLTAKLLLTDTEVISLAPALDYSDRNLLDTFSKLDVKLCSESDEIEYSDERQLTAKD